MDLREYGERYGYQHYRCRIHGSTWSDSGGCDLCADARAEEGDEEEESEEDDDSEC